MPCQKCVQRSTKCEYTRQGYIDPYEVFRSIEQSRPIADDENASIALDSFPHDERPVVVAAVHASGSDMDATADLHIGERTATDFTDDGEPRTAFQVTNGEFDLQSPNDINGEHLQHMSDFGYALNDIDLGLEELDWDSLLAVPPGPHSLTISTQSFTIDEAELALSPSDSAHLAAAQGFELQQLDRVEAKVVELRSFLQSSAVNICDSQITVFVTRENLLSCIKLYGLRYHPVMPIVHIPTFELVKTDRVLLLAMMLVGACYSDSIATGSAIIQLAVHVLLTIEALPHERNMSVPPLSVVQASALLCHILVITKNPFAYDFAHIHRARMISMAERAGVFSDDPSTEYLCLTRQSFDWYQWINTEMRRRLAHHIFVTDQGNCIFMKGSTFFSPFTFDVHGPCYQSCWTAPTAEQCLKELQTSPTQIRLSEAVKGVRSAKPAHHMPIQASDSAMHSIIIGLHALLSHAIDASLDHENILPVGISSDGYLIKPNLSELLTDQLVNHQVDDVASNLVSKHGTDSFKHVNDALNSWRRAWNSSPIHDIYSGDNGPFGHPLNFFLLAKLFIVLHFLRHRNVAEDFAGQRAEKDELVAYCAAKDGTMGSKISIQEQVIKWLSRLRRRSSLELSQANNLVSQVINTG